MEKFICHVFPLLQRGSHQLMSSACDVHVARCFNYIFHIYDREVIQRQSDFHTTPSSLADCSLWWVPTLFRHVIFYTMLRMEHRDIGQRSTALLHQTFREYSTTKFSIRFRANIITFFSCFVHATQKSPYLPHSGTSRPEKCSFFWMRASRMTSLELSTAIGIPPIQSV